MIRTFIGLPVVLCIAALGYAVMRECEADHWRFFALCVTLLVSACMLAAVASVGGVKGAAAPSIPGTRRVSMEELKRTIPPFTPSKPPEPKP